ncbi:MAG: KH domain-containing protein [Myxococcales bacterium]|nr:KH domain-containing protein [Myxococcales bacterium]
MSVELVEFLVKSVVSDTDNVKVVETVDADRVDYKVSVAKDDVGRFIGRNGQTVGAIRTLVSAAARRQGLRATVDTDE